MWLGKHECKRIWAQRGRFGVHRGTGMGLQSLPVPPPSPPGAPRRPLSLCLFMHSRVSANVYKGTYFVPGDRGGI